MNKSGNPSFDAAIKHLSQFHELAELGGYPMLDLSHRPKGLRSDKAWRYYYTQLSSMLVIGLRNKWIRQHVNGVGQPVYLVIDIK